VPEEDNRRAAIEYRAPLEASKRHASYAFCTIGAPNTGKANPPGVPFLTRPVTQDSQLADACCLGPQYPLSRSQESRKLT
jgi:hypothetical protein